MVTIDQLLENQTTIKNQYFENIADTILNKTILEINSEPYRICEIEFYLHSRDHPDKYTHSNPDQLNYGYWYFHKYRNGHYKTGNYKGLDIALGNKSNTTFCGILIRSMYDLNEKEMIEGPCKCVNKVLSIYNIRSISEFVGFRLLSVRANHRGFCLVNGESKLKAKSIYKGERIGLSNKYPEFRWCLYRYLIFDNLIKKDRTSRVQCSVGDIKKEDKSSISTWI